MAKEFKTYNGIDVDSTDIMNINLLQGQGESVSLSEIRSAYLALNSGVTLADLDLIENNILLNSFRIASEESLSILNLVDGIADEYIDESGVDTGASVNQEYNSGSDYYSPTFSLDSTTKLLLHLDGTDGATSTTDASLSAHTINFVGTAQIDDAQQQFGTASLLLDGDSDYLSISDSTDWDICATNTEDWTIDLWVKMDKLTGGIGIVSQAADNLNRWEIGHTDGLGLKFLLRNPTIVIDTGFAGEINDNNWHHLALCKVADKYAIYKDGIQINYVQSSATGTFSAPLTIGTKGVGLGDYFGGHLDEVRISNENVFSASPNAGLTDTITVPTSAFSGFPDNMTLISEAFAAESQPETGRIVIAEEDVDSVTINTDLKSYVSRDDGTTWEEITLEDLGNIEGNKRVIASLFDFPTGIPSGTDMRYKIETLNNKNIKIHATGLFWE